VWIDILNTGTPLDLNLGVFKGRLAFRLFCEEFRNRFGENVLEASDSDIEKLIRCSFEYGQRGFQEQAKTAADRGTK
jgi:hypothetical protein